MLYEAAGGMDANEGLIHVITARLQGIAVTLVQIKRIEPMTSSFGVRTDPQVCYQGTLDFSELP